MKTKIKKIDFEILAIFIISLIIGRAFSENITIPFTVKIIVFILVINIVVGIYYKNYHKEDEFSVRNLQKSMENFQEEEFEKNQKHL